MTAIQLPPGRLWPNAPSGAPVEIEVIGVTGEYQAGKTIFLLSIAPGLHPAGHPSFATAPRTLMLDMEKSSGTYGGAGCRRIDVPAILLEKHGGSYTPLQAFLWFLDLIETKLKPGQFDVIAVDPVSDIEAGLVAFVKENPGRFGLTPDQIKKAGGLLWGAVKDYWKLILLKLATCCKTFGFTSHLRDEWTGNVPTGKREPKGKETLMELASLYLWLERKPDASGNVPDMPSAIVLKQRLADTFIGDDGGLRVQPLLPPRLPVATVAAIRQYIAAPPDYGMLSAGERVREEEVSAETKLRLELAKAEAVKEAEGSRLQRLERMAELQKLQREAAAAPGPAPSADQAAAMQKTAEEKAKADAEIAKAQAEYEAKLAKTKDLEAKLMKEQPEEHRRPGDPPPASADDCPFDPNQQPAEDPTKASRDQVTKIRDLATRLQLDREKLGALLARANVVKVSDLSREHAAMLISRLEAKAKELEGKAKK